MGCDIHEYLEYRPNGNTTWYIHRASVSLGRNYSVFAHLAGVRNYGEVTPIAAGRGLPVDADHRTRCENCVYVSDSGRDGTVSRERAEGWIKSGSSKWYHEGVFVTNPDWHSHSWCTLAELKLALERSEGYDDSYRYLVAVMELTEQLGHECRLVFWFDN